MICILIISTSMYIPKIFNHLLSYFPVDFFLKFIFLFYFYFVFVPHLEFYCIVSFSQHFLFFFINKFFVYSFVMRDCIF